MKQYLRNPSNTNQGLTYDSTFNSYSVYVGRGPLILSYLASIERCLLRSLDDYSSVFVLRIDLKLPTLSSWPDDRLMERFIASLRSQISHSQSRVKDQGKRVHATSLRYVWCKEYSQSDQPHYHVALLMNKQSYWRVGAYEYGQDNLYSMIVNAWLRALGLNQSVDARYLVHFTENGEYIMRKDDAASINAVFYRLSYLCKLDTKPHGTYKHNFGCSRS